VTEKKLVANIRYWEAFPVSERAVPRTHARTGTSRWRSGSS